METANKKSFELLFLGTCACDFSPRLETELKDRFDNDARRSSALLINGRFLIDCGVHTLESLSIAGVARENITDIFITHLHRDHYNPNHIAEIAKAKKAPLRLWVREDAKIPEIENVSVIRMTQFETYEVAMGLSVTAMPANHSPAAFPQHFVFERSGDKIFYGCDGAWFLHDSFKYLRGAKLSLAVLDCTVGDYVGDFRLGEHNSIPMIRLMLPSLQNIGAIDENTKIVLSHLAPSLHKSHAQTVEIVKDFGIVAFDGMECYLPEGK